MKTFLFAIFIAIAASGFADEDDPCFEENSKDGWIPVKEKCMGIFAAGTEDRVKKVFGCMYKEKGMLNEDATVLDYEKFKAAYENAKAKDLTEMFEAMDKCYESADHAVVPFFDCFVPKLKELCPETIKWSEGI